MKKKTKQIGARKGTPKELDKLLKDWTYKPMSLSGADELMAIELLREDAIARAQARLNIAALAWDLDEGDTWLENKKNGWNVSPHRIELAKAVRAFYKASNR